MSCKCCTKMAPESVFTSVTDKNDFMKFVKFLVMKGVQIIVQSRKGDRVNTECKEYSSDTDWFNLAIPDAIDVTIAMKKVFTGDILSTFRSQLCVEISLRTVDGDEMVLETWIFNLDQTQFDPSLKTMSTVYYRMGLLLKSLIAVTRITPAYKLARYQKLDSYSLFYHIYSGEPKTHCLGDGMQKVRAGLLRTPLGGICISLAYRTKMIISPNKKKDTTLVLKSDHFELSPKRVVGDHSEIKEVKVKPPIDLNTPLRPAAFVDLEKIDELIKAFHAILPIPKSKYTRKREPLIPEGELSHSTHPTWGEQGNNLDNCSLKSLTPNELPPRWFSRLRSENEPPLKLLHCPFADKNPISDLAEFYRDFFNAPKLIFLDDAGEGHLDYPLMYESAHGDLSKELDEFERSAHEFDEMVASMYYSTI